MKITKKLEIEIQAVMDDYWGSYLKGDLPTWASYLPDDYRNIGATKAELWNSKKEIVEYTEMIIDQTVGMAEMRNKQTQVIPYDPYLMVHELGDVYVKAEEGWIFYAQIRLSSLLGKTADGWKILHQHGSYPDSKTGEGEAFAFSELNVENKKLRDAIQSRTIDLERKNRELEIEAALERVRARTMAMHRSDELGTTSLLLFDELKALGEISEQISIGIFDEDNQVLNLYATLHGEQWKEASKVDLDEPHAMQKIHSGWREKKKSIRIDLSGEELKAYNRFRSQYSNLKFPDERWVIHCAFFSKGVLSFSTTTPHEEQTMQLLERFAQVFDGTYTRFLDLQKAEAQTREAQIEAALERVRARTMAMHSSDELLETGAVLFKELSKLGVNIFNCGYVLMDDDAKRGWNYGVNPGDGTIRPLPTGIPQSGTKVLEAITESWRKQEPFLLIELDPQETIEHQTYMAENLLNFSLTKEELLARSPERLVIHTFNFKHGYLLLVGGAKLTADQQEMVRRFAHVFEQTYIRFLDLQKAEAQAREAQIEAALEKVRSRTMAMHSPRELEEVVAVIAEKLQDLGIILDANGVILCTYFKDSRDVMHWISAPDFSGSGRYLLPYFEHPIFSAAWESKMSGDDYFSRSFTVEEKNSFFKYAFEHSDYRHFPEEFKQWVFQNDKHSLSFAWAENSAILIPSHTGILPTEADIEILKRFAKVFEQAYVRFMDLQTKEEQAAKIAEEKQRLEKTLHDLQVTQKQLIHSEKMASLGELTAGIAHEIQNPLNFVNNFSEINEELISELVDELNSGNTEEAKVIAADIKSNAQRINEHGKRAGSIVKGMLEHSRKSDGQKERTDINALCDEYLRLAYHGLRAKDKTFNASFETHFDPNLPKTEVIPQDIGRVILNLINNAFYAVNEKSKAEIQKPGSAYQPKVIVRTNSLDNKIEISVNDNGNGIPDHIKDKIFQPFFTTKPAGQGTGLGLSLSYDIITKGHGGEIHAESNEGECPPDGRTGTTFSIKIPIR